MKTYTHSIQNIKKNKFYLKERAFAHTFKEEEEFLSKDESI
jgi:hypothetical protein